MEKTVSTEDLECNTYIVNDRVIVKSNDLKELLEDLRMEQLETA